MPNLLLLIVLVHLVDIDIFDFERSLLLILLLDQYLLYYHLVQLLGWHAEVGLLALLWFQCLAEIREVLEGGGGHWLLLVVVGLDVVLDCVYCFVVDGLIIWLGLLIFNGDVHNFISEDFRL